MMYRTEARIAGCLAYLKCNRVLHDGWQNRASALVVYEYIVFETKIYPSLLVTVNSQYRRSMYTTHFNACMTRQTLSMWHIIISIVIVSLTVEYFECILSKRYKS